MISLVEFAAKLLKELPVEEQKRISAEIFKTAQKVVYDEESTQTSPNVARTPDGHKPRPGTIYITSISEQLGRIPVIKAIRDINKGSKVKEAVGAVDYLKSGCPSYICDVKDIGSNETAEKIRLLEEAGAKVQIKWISE